MKKIRFKSSVEVTDINDDSVVTDIDVIKSFDGIKYEDELCADYLSDGGDTTLAEAGVTGGLLYLKFDDTTQNLFVYVEYDLERDLTPTELALLKEETSGQISDGVGSNFEQEMSMESHIIPVLEWEDLQIEP